MAGNTLDQAAQMLSGGAPGTTMVGPNTRVKGEGGFLGTQSDALMFAHGGAGNWLVVNTRVRVAGVFTVSATAQGISQPPAPSSPVPVTVVPGNPKIRST